MVTADVRGVSRLPNLRERCTWGGRGGIVDGVFADNA